MLEAINKFLGSLKLPKWEQLGDNEQCYILRRSHERLRTKGDYVDMARDAAKRKGLGLRRNEAVRERLSYRFRDGESELNANTWAVVEVFSGRADNAVIEVERADGRRRVVLRQGDENRDGTKLALFRHCEAKSSYTTADDIAMVPEIIAKGKRSVNGKRLL